MFSGAVRAVFRKKKGFGFVKILHWLLLVLFSAATALARLRLLAVGFDADGLPVPMDLNAMALPAVLIVAAVIAVIMLYYLVGHWNDFFNALLYLRSRAKYPLSLVLREILLQGVGQEKTGAEVIDSVADLLLFETLKYAVIIVSSVPMLLLYPALQRYFVKGAMVGSLKG